MKTPTLLLVCLAGCAGAPQHEKDYAWDRLVNCLDSNARRLDDRTSDARSIGRTVAGACLSEGNYAAETATRGRGGFYRAGYMREFGSQMIEAATRIVLEVRSGQR